MLLARGGLTDIREKNSAGNSSSTFPMRPPVLCLAFVIPFVGTGRSHVGVVCKTPRKPLLNNLPLSSRSSISSVFSLLYTLLSLPLTAFSTMKSFSVSLMHVLIELPYRIRSWQSCRGTGSWAYRPSTRPCLCLVSLMSPRLPEVHRYE